MVSGVYIVGPLCTQLNSCNGSLKRDCSVSGNCLWVIRIPFHLDFQWCLTEICSLSKVIDRQWLPIVIEIWGKCSTLHFWDTLYDTIIPSPFERKMIKETSPQRSWKKCSVLFSYFFFMTTESPPIGFKYWNEEIFTKFDLWFLIFIFCEYFLQPYYNVTQLQMKIYYPYCPIVRQ